MSTFREFAVSGVLLVCTSVLLMPSIAQADGRTVAIGVGVTNNTGNDKTDFHIKVSSDTNMDVTSARLKDPNGNFIDGTVGGDNTNMFTVDWDVAVNQGQKITWGAIFKQEEKNKYNVTEAYFTPKESPTDVPVVGWRVEADGDVYLTNEFEVGIDFSELFFQFPIDITIDSIMGLTDAAPSGTPGLVSSGTVPAASLGLAGELLVGEFSLLNPGDFLTARLDSAFADPGFSSLTATVALGHEHQVPEPTSAALALLGLLSLVGIRTKQTKVA
jgi:hypothetical protein